MKRNEQATINFLRSQASSQQGKNNRNGRKFTNSSDWSTANTRTLSPLGWMFQDYSDSDDGTITPKVNVTKSIIDTYISKIASQKVIPLFTPKKGSLTTRKVVKAAQTYFDDLFYSKGANDKITMAERYACVFDFGYVWANTWTKDITTLAPWQIGIFQNEWQYNGKGTKALVIYKDYPATQLSEYGIANDMEKTYVDFEIYYDVENHVSKLFVDKKEVKAKKWNGTFVPIVPYYFNSPLLGWRTTGLLDDLLPLQEQVDVNVTRIKDAINGMPLNIIFTPLDQTNKSVIDITQLKAGSVGVMKYRPTPGVTEPIKAVSPPPVDMFYLQYHEKLVKDMQDMAGISELSSQGESPGANNSGKFIETMEKIENTRFEVQLNRVIHSYVRLAETFIDSFDDDDEILPVEKNRDRITWGQLKKEIGSINVMFTAASALSNDPQKQIEILQSLSQLGAIDQTRIAEFIDLPDAESAFDDTNSIPNAVEKKINEALEDENYEIPLFMDYDALRDRIMINQNKYYALDGDHLEEIGRLQKLFLELDKVMGPQEEEAPPQEQGGTVNPEEGFKSLQGLTPSSLAAEPNIMTEPLNDAAPIDPAQNMIQNAGGV